MLCFHGRFSRDALHAKIAICRKWLSDLGVIRNGKFLLLVILRAICGLRGKICKSIPKPHLSMPKKRNTKFGQNILNCPQKLHFYDFSLCFTFAICMTRNEFGENVADSEKISIQFFDLQL